MYEGEKSFFEMRFKVFPEIGKSGGRMNIVR